MNNEDMHFIQSNDIVETLQHKASELGIRPDKLIIAVVDAAQCDPSFLYVALEEAFNLKSEQIEEFLSGVAKQPTHISGACESTWTNDAELHAHIVVAILNEFFAERKFGTRFRVATAYHKTKVDKLRAKTH